MCTNAVLYRGGGGGALASSSRAPAPARNFFGLLQDEPQYESINTTKTVSKRESLEHSVAYIQPPVPMNQSHFIDSVYMYELVQLCTRVRGGLFVRNAVLFFLLDDRWLQVAPTTVNRWQLASSRRHLLGNRDRPVLYRAQASYRIVSYRIVSYRIVSYRIVSYRIVLIFSIQPHHCS